MTPATLAIAALLVTQSALEEAVYREVALGETEEALAAYSRILRDLDTPADEQARALHRLAVCHAKMGSPGEARVALADLGFRFRDMPDINGRARAEVARHVGVEGLVMTLAGATGEEAWKAARTLACLAPDSVPALQRALESWDPFLRWRSAVTLWEIRDARGLDAILEAVKESGRHCPIFDRRSAGEVLAEMLDEIPDLRARVVDAVRETGDDRARGDLLEAVGDRIGTSPILRKVARDLLAVPGLRETGWTYLVQHAPPEEVVGVALARLASDGPGEIREVLRGYLERAREDPRFLPADSDRLFQVILARREPEIIETITPDLREWIEGPWGISAEVALDLADRIPGQGAGNLMDGLVSRSMREENLDEIRPRCIDVYCRLILDDAFDEFPARKVLLEAMARGDPAGTERVLSNILKDGKYFDLVELPWEWRRRIQREHSDLLTRAIRESVPEMDPYTLLWCIRDHGGRHRMPLLDAVARRWPDRHGNVVSMVRSIGDPSAVGILRRLLKSWDPRTRRDALYNLGCFGAREAADDIRPFLDDPDREIRESAAFALEEFRRMEEEPAEWWAWYEAR